MPLIQSYACNQEDVLLQQLLVGVTDGFYLDVGAFLPMRDSNSYAFYLQGWSGIVVEPLAHIYQEVVERWAAERPRDFLIKGMAADRIGKHEFYPCSAGQCSTGSRQLISRWLRDDTNSAAGKPVMVPCWTLNHLLHHRQLKEIHFLSLDTEGMENEVLRGFDLKKYRPWVIVVENTVPGPLTKSDLDETLLVDYRKIHDDGVNGFYLANEHADLWE